MRAECAEFKQSERTRGMPSIGSVVAMETAREADLNQKNGIGFIAVHPVKGVFLGVDDAGAAVFEKIAELAPGQPIPAFLQPEWVPIEACRDSKILECSLYRVDLSEDRFDD